MRFLIHRPSMPLAQFVDFFWFYDGLTPAHRLERVLPDGSFELIINLREEPRHTYDTDNLSPSSSFSSAWISGTQSGYLVIDTAPDSSMIGIHFLPGGAAPFLGFPANEFQEQVIELDGLWGVTARDLRSALLEAATPSSKFRQLEAFLLTRSVGNLSLPKSIAHALHLLQNAPESASIRKIASELGWSHKHFVDRFQSSVGIPPKRFSRIRRFQQARQALQNSTTSSWSDLALTYGYYDQAHFNTEFKAFSGLSPTQFLFEARGRENFIPIRGTA